MDDESTTPLIHAVGAAAESRVPLDVTLAALAEEQVDPHVAAAARRLSAELQRGVPVDQAVAALGDDLPPEIRGLLSVGVESGDLAGTIERFAELRLAADRARRRIRAAIAYPLLIGAILVPLALFLSVFVIPMFGELYEEFDLNLPPITEVLLTTSRQMPMFLGALLFVLIGIPIALRVLGGRWLLHRTRAATPLVGRLWSWSAQREFAAMLASFLTLRVPTASAVANTGQVMSDRNMARACSRLAERLGAGMSLSEGMSQSIHFDRTLVALVAWGEQHHLLPEALSIATEVFEDRIEQYAALMRRILPTVTLVFVATLMFAVIVGLFIPLINLIEGLSG
jgi:type IV pilus assembly protein PilC